MRIILVLCGAFALALGLAGCGGDSDAGGSGSSGDRPTVVVTHAVLASVVEDLFGDTADVETVMPEGTDPHTFEPSARDVEMIRDADLVVANGLGFEAGLNDVLHDADEDGTPVFWATDHVKVIGGDHDHMDMSAMDMSTMDMSTMSAEEHEQMTGDPHFWLDPRAVRGVTAALAQTAGDTLGLDVGTRAADLSQRLKALDGEVRVKLQGIPPERRLLVAGHDSLGYFAGRYGFRVLGSLIEGWSTAAEPSAADLDRLTKRIENRDVEVIFTEANTPPAITDAITGETGARAVPLLTETLPDDGSYFTLMRQDADAIAGALNPT